MVIFEGAAGRVVALRDAAAIGTLALVDTGDAPIQFETQRSIITRLTVNQQVNMQFLHTMGKHVYVYVFGDRIGQIGLSGLSFAQSCAADDPDIRHGGELMMDWYRANKASKRQSPIRVGIGARDHVDGFVSGFSFDVVDPQSMMVQWGCNLMSLPDE